MPLFKYKAVNQKGQPVRGTVEAPSAVSANELLVERQLVVLSLTEQRGRIQINLDLALGGIKRKDVVIFARQLAVMISANVPIVQSLRVLATQTESRIFKEKIRAMADDVDGGMKLSSAFAKYPKAFNHFFVAMIRSGETSGRLDEILNYLADEMEKDYDLISRIRGAMVYPIFIVVGLLVVAVVMLIFVIPKMAGLLRESGAQLPLATRLLLGTSDFMQTYWWLVLFFLLSGLVVFRALTRNPAGHEWWDGFKLRLPIFGTLFQKIILVRFSRSLATLIRGGVPISISLDITSEVVNNYAYRALIQDTIKEVEDGNSIATVFTDSKLVPNIVAQMMVVGEKTGRIDDVMDKLGTFYAREVDALVSSLTSLIEPIIMVVMGVGVGGMVAAVIMPMFQVANSIS